MRKRENVMTTMGGERDKEITRLEKVPIREMKGRDWEIRKGKTRCQIFSLYLSLPIKLHFKL